MSTDPNADALLHLADALSDDILSTGDDELFAEVEEDHQSRQTLIAKFDRISRRSLRRARRQRLVERLRELIELPWPSGRLANLRWPMFSGWQWSGLGSLAAATAAIFVFGFQFWHQPSRVASDHSSQSVAPTTVVQLDRRLQPQLSQPQDIPVNYAWKMPAPPVLGESRRVRTIVVRPSGSEGAAGNGNGQQAGQAGGDKSPATPNNPKQFRPEQSFQIAVVTLEDLAKWIPSTREQPNYAPQPQASVRNEYGRQRSAGRVAATAPREESITYRFRDIAIPTDLLQRAIESASNDKGAVEHSELMDFLRAQNQNTYNNQARILIDSALADGLSKKVEIFQRSITEVLVYDLDDLRAASLGSKIDPPPGHYLFLTGVQNPAASYCCYTFEGLGPK